MPAPSACVSAVHRVAGKSCQESSRQIATRTHRVRSQELTICGVSSGPSVSVSRILLPESRARGTLLWPDGVMVVKVNAAEENGMEVGRRCGHTSGVKVAERWRMRARPATRDSVAADVCERLCERLGRAPAGWASPRLSCPSITLSVHASRRYHLPEATCVSISAGSPAFKAAGEPHFRCRSN